MYVVQYIHKVPIPFYNSQDSKRNEKVPFSRNLEFFLKQQIDAKYRGFLRNKKFQIMYIYCFVATPLRAGHATTLPRQRDQVFRP